MSTPTDAQSFSNISATTSAFPLKGGSYSWDCVFTGVGTVGLQALGPDGSTYLPVPGTALTSSGFTSPLWLAAGQYREAVSGSAGAIYADVAGVPSL
jgi:hypothetical protein